MASVTRNLAPRVEAALKALLQWRGSKSETQKPQLLEVDEFVYLVITLKKIPQKGVSRTAAYKISLPHPIFSPDSDNCQFCLIIDDRSKSGLTKEAAKKKIEEDNILVSKLIKLSKLRSDYRPFEAKRKLLGSYDLFFADKRVIPVLPRLLGKHFFIKKKIPVPLNLCHKNWKEQMERACSSALMYLNTGTCSVLKVAKLSMSKEEIVENAVAAIDGILKIVPKKWSGVRSLHLKLFESLALPLYQTLPDLKLKIENSTVAESKAEEVVKEQKPGKRRGQMREVRYMDVDLDNKINYEDDTIEKETREEDEAGGDEEDETAHELVEKQAKNMDESIFKNMGNVNHGEFTESKKGKRKTRNNRAAIVEDEDAQSGKMVKNKNNKGKRTRIEPLEQLSNNDLEEEEHLTVEDQDMLKKQKSGKKRGKIHQACETNSKGDDSVHHPLEKLGKKKDKSKTKKEDDETNGELIKPRREKQTVSCNDAVREEDKDAGRGKVTKVKGKIKKGKRTEKEITEKLDGDGRVSDEKRMKKPKGKVKKMEDGTKPMKAKGRLKSRAGTEHTVKAI